jgi:hypothetical protein
MSWRFLETLIRSDLGKLWLGDHTQGRLTLISAGLAGRDVHIHRGGVAVHETAMQTARSDVDQGGVAVHESIMRTWILRDRISIRDLLHSS